MRNEEPRICVVIVTYNRCEQLRTTLDHYRNSQLIIKSVIVVNNASTDDTRAMLEGYKKNWADKLVVVDLPNNSGGAGGFNEGVKRALDTSADWIFLSDDDATPDSKCLEILSEAAQDRNCVYGAVAVASNGPAHELCWPVQSKGEKGGQPSKRKRFYDELDEMEYPAMLPFLGFMVHRLGVLDVGLPNEDYFISGDDVEYCIRLQRAGYILVQVKSAVMRHPLIPREVVSLFGREFLLLKMPAWRRSLDIRNRIWNARLESGRAGTLAVCMFAIFSIFMVCLKLPNKFEQVKAIARGVFDGVATRSRNHKSSDIL